MTCSIPCLDWRPRSPHILDNRLLGDLSDEDQQSVERYRAFLQRRHLPDTMFAKLVGFEPFENLLRWPQLSDTEIAERLDSLVRRRHQVKLEAVAADILSELPTWVWSYFSNGMPIPMPPRMRASPFRAGGTATAVQVIVFSRGYSGAEMESFLRSHAELLRAPADSAPVSRGSLAVELTFVDDAFEFNDQGQRGPLPVLITRNRRQRVGFCCLAGL
jgi:hypothetical protein